MIVQNTKENTNEIDMGIVSKYRNQGYGTYALNILKQIIDENNLDVTIQVNESNIAAIKSVTNNGFVLTKKIEKYNYYINGSKKGE